MNENKDKLLQQAENIADELGLNHLHHRFILRFAQFVADMLFADNYEEASHFIFLNADIFYKWKDKISEYRIEHDNPTISQWLSFYLEFLEDKGLIKREEEKHEQG